MSEAVIYQLPAELRTALLTYLASRPYAEVAQGIQALQALQPLTQNADA